MIYQLKPAETEEEHFGPRGPYQRKLEEVALHFAKAAFVPSYVRSAPLDERKEEGLGIALSQWAEWDGMRLMRVFRAALEDSNFHEEAALVEDMIKEAAAR